MGNLRMLLVFNPENKSHRVLGRGVVMGLLAFGSIVATAIAQIAPAWAAVFMAVSAMLDKIYGEMSKENK